MTTAQKPDALDAIRAMCTGRIEWRVARDDGAYCMSFSRDDSLNPEQEANEWLARHLCDYPERFMDYKVQRVVVQSQLQEEALALITRLSDANASLLAKEAECEALREDAERWRFARLGSLTATVIEVSGEIRNAGHRYRPHELAMEWAEKIDAAIDAARAAADQGGAS